MMLWVIFAVLTAAAAAAVLRPYWGQRVGDIVSPPDVEIFKQQLREVEGERERGLIGEREAEAAKFEISRRLIAASEKHERSAAAGGELPQRTPHALSVVAIAVLAVVSVGLYLNFGRPDAPSQPAASRQPDQTAQPDQGQSQAAQAEQVAQMDAMIAKVEARLKEHPEDGQGWEVMAQIYFSQSRFGEAATAYANAVKHLGETGDRLANLGQALTFANSGTVSPDARKAFEKATMMDPGNGKAQVWLALADEQDGKTAEAGVRYQTLLRGKFPEGVQKFARERLAGLNAPSGDAAATQQPPPQQQDAPPNAEMIDGMVTRLAERLKQDGSDLQGWLKLIKSYIVLQRRDDALNALKEARAKFEGNNDALGQIDASARELGLAP